MEDKEKKVAHLQEQMAKIQEELTKFQGEGASTEKVKELFSWIAPSRIFIPRDKKWFTNIFIIVLIVGVILLFLREFMLIGVVFAVTFVGYVLATVPPQEVGNKITSHGLTTAEHSYVWNELADFWFSKKYGEFLLNINTVIGFPGRLTMIVKEYDIEKIKNLLADYLPFREFPETRWTEKLTEKVVSKLPEASSKST